MDAVASTRSFLDTWYNGGEQQCRDTVLAAYSALPSRSAVDTIATTYHSLVGSLLKSWSFPNILTPTTLVSFLRSIISQLPSSSSLTNSIGALLSDQLLDMIWSMDVQLVDIFNDAEATISALGGQATSGGEAKASALNGALLVKGNAEHDKGMLTQILKLLLLGGMVSATGCMEKLEVALLVDVGLVTDKKSFDRREVRTRTHQFYRQNKFNLLREQSEGYSKLISELTSNLGPPHSNVTGRPLESHATIHERARVVWQKVNTLIGFFDLDSNRALDIILDVYSAHIGTHHSFFSALLSFSPWAGSSRLSPTDGETTPAMPEYEGKTLDEILSFIDPTSKEMNNTLQDGPMLAQVLGFKFAYYQSAEVEMTPKTLYLLTALLIRDGFMGLEDIYPHMSPDDMEGAKKDYLATIQARMQNAKSSLLAMAAPLESSGPGKTKSTVPETKKPETKAVPDQRAGLLAALLAVGALRPAISLMTLYPWLVDAFPEIADLMIQILKYSIHHLYISTMKEPRSTFSQPRGKFGPLGVTTPPQRRSVLCLWAPTPPSTSTVDFVFFFPRWTERIPTCSELQDLVYVIEPLMKFIGVHISRDATFLTKLMRLARVHLQSTVPLNEAGKRVGELDENDPICAFWYMIARCYFLPALSLIRGNAVFTVEVWAVVRLFSSTARWRLYGEWRNVYKTHPELRIREVQCTREAKGMLRRLAHDSVDSLAGPVAKLAHSNPSIFFTNAINQIMSYDNMADVVIQVLRYVTNMGFEVLVYVLLDALSHPTKARVKDDGVNSSDWLQNLASFAGMLFHRYHTDLTPVLNYVVHQLYSGQTTEVIVLRELILKMAGIEPLPDLSDQQVIAMAGGPALRIEAVASKTRGARLEAGDSGLKGPQRLGRYLLDSSLALPLLIQVAQQRQSCVYKAQSAHLKSLAGLYDNTHGVLCQYLELLTTPSVVSPEEYAMRVLPSLAELGHTYGICAPICMQIIRPVIHAKLLASTLSTSMEETEKRLKAEMVARKKPTPSRVASPSMPMKDIDSKPSSSEEINTTEGAVTDENTMAVDSIPAVPIPQSPWLPELTALFDDVRKIVPSQALDVIGAGFYTTFWQLSTYDLSPPLGKYEEEMASLKAASRAEDTAMVNAERSNDRSVRARATLHRQRRERYNDYAQILSKEAKEQSIMRAATIKRLAREKQHWFSHCPRAAIFANTFMEYCLQPRCLLSPMDADYCAQIVKVLHLLGTPGFPALTLYDKLLSDYVRAVIFSCSEYEARNFGRFLKGILTDLYRWHQDEQAYIQDSRSKSGGKVILHPGFQTRFNHKSVVTQDDLLKWTDLKRAVRKWHTKLGKCLADCIQMKEFMHVYNAILVLKEILPVFPLITINESGRMLYDAVEVLLENEQRGDLKMICTTYLSSLKSRQSLWSKPASSAPNGVPSPAPSVASDNSRSTNPPPVNGRSNPPIVAPTPSAPRSQLSNIDRPGSGMASAKMAMDSIPRPEVVKRVRTEPRSGPSPQPPSEIKVQPSSTPPHTPITGLDIRQVDMLRPPGNGPRVSSPLSNAEGTRKETLSQEGSRSSTPVQPFEGKPNSSAAMPPPSIPSQTMSAQELRETAKQSMSRPQDNGEDRTPRPSLESKPRSSSLVPLPSSSRRRSLSPPSRPGTRNGSVDSRHSGGRSRSDRDDSKRSERPDRDSRQEHRELSRRDSLTHSRRDRHRDSDRDDRDRERERGRDRHGDRERERSERERDRDKDRERDKDRHLRDEKDRERDSRKGAPPTPDDRNQPSRPDGPRHRDDSGNLKRRRGYDEDSDRGAKRSARKDHRDDRSRRDREGSDRRDFDKRRKDREDNDDQPSTPVERPPDRSERRVPDGPSSSKTLPPSTPSGPRAMTESRGSLKAEGGRDRRDPPTAPNGHPGGSGPESGGLRSRISGKDSRGAPTSPSSSYPPSGPLDDRDGPRKRTVSDRDRDTLGSPDTGTLESQPSKRLKLKRDRYPPTGLAPPGLAQKTLPLARGGTDRRGRKD